MIKRNLSNILNQRYDKTALSRNRRIDYTCAMKILPMKTTTIKHITNKILKIAKIALLTLGSLFTILCVLSLTPLPYYTRAWLGRSINCDKNFTPRYIIMLGGGGMPSEENLIRLYYTAEAATIFPLAQIIVAHPFDSISYIKMRHDLMIRGIDSSRIHFEHFGLNTRAQALFTAKLFPDSKTANTMIVSSPEHIRRSIFTFRKAGYTSLCGYAATEIDMDIDLTVDQRIVGGRRFIPNVDNNVGMRYNFWTYFKIEISCLREFTALSYYWIKGWI